MGVKKIRIISLMILFIISINLMPIEVLAEAIVQNEEIELVEEINKLDINEQNEGINKNEDKDENSEEGIEENKNSEEEMELNSEKEAKEKNLEKEENLEKENQEKSELVNTLKGPINDSKMTEDIYIKGNIISSEGMSYVKVYIDDKEVGLAKIDKDSYSYEVKGLSNGRHKISTIAIDEKNNIDKKDSYIEVNSNQKTSIMGKSILDKNKMVKTILNRNPNKTAKYAYSFVEELVEEANAEGVRYDIAFAQIMHETNYLKFGGDVKESQNNFAGLGATGGGNPGESFPTIEIGLRAVIQHLKAYASKENLIRECVDTRFKYVERESALYLEHLGINENPRGKGWAVNKGYGYLIYDILNNVNNQTTENMEALISEIKLNGNLEPFEKIKIISKASENALYKVSIKDSNGKWKVMRDFTEEAEYTWTPEKSGKYRIVIDVKNKFSNKEYDDFKYIDVEIINVESKIQSFDRIGEIYINKENLFKAISNSNSLYKFTVRDPNNNWKVISDFSETNEIRYIPKEQGKYRIVVDVKHKSSEKEYDDFKYIDFEVKGIEAVIEKLEIKGDLINESSIEFNTKAISGNKVLYKYSIKEYENNEWKVVQEYNGNSKYVWKPVKAGKYRIVVDVKDEKSDKEYDDYTFKDITIRPKKLAKIKDVKIVNGNTLGEKRIDVVADAENSILYKYSLKDYSTNKWITIKDYSHEKVQNFKVEKGGKYRIVVDIKDEYSENDFDDYFYQDIEIYGEDIAKVQSLRVKGNNNIRDSKIIVAEASSKNKILYKYEIEDTVTGEKNILNDFSVNKELQWKVKKPGQYKVKVFVKDVFSKNEYDNVMVVTTEIYGPIQISVQNFTINGKYETDEILKIKSIANSKNGVQYRYTVRQPNGEWRTIKDYSESQYVDYKVPKQKGKYRFVIDYKDKFSDREYDEYEYREIYIDESRLIVIDPGHNINTLYGVDTGASSTFGGVRYKEEVLNMQVATKLKEELEKKGFKVMMTQENGYVSKDKTLRESLERRVNVANANNAELFVSIHHNSGPSSATGTEVYYSSNKSSNMEAEKVKKNKELAIEMSSEIARAGGYKNRGGKDNDFFVTKNTKMPSILAEIAFISNEQEVKKAQNDVNQRKVAIAMANKIESFMGKI